MGQPLQYPISPGWRLVLKDVGIAPRHVLRRAGLPEDLFIRERATVDTDEYFALWRALEEEAADPRLPLRIGESLTVEAFDPPLFAALCSPDLNTALGRVAHYKRLVCPLKLHLEIGPRTTTLGFEWLGATTTPPAAMVATELVFFVQLARLATRESIHAVEVSMPEPPAPAKSFAAYFGVGVKKAARPSLSFSRTDAERPFLTVNERMWQFFEPELRGRLSALEQNATVSERVAAALLELLPSGSGTMEGVAKKLGMSKRTLQRRLLEEGTGFQQALDKTREQLARHYLRRSTLSGAEISFLLGFEDPNSFFRAFHAWTGMTPEKVRYG